MSIDFQRQATAIRRHIINMAHSSKGPHTGSALSCVDLLTVLYFDTMRLDDWDNRDIGILSKGHAAKSLYATLAERGIIDTDILAGYLLDNGTLPAHLDMQSAKGVEVSAGSLGHGFNVGLGYADGFRRQQQDRRVYVVIGDGEMQEGSIWEGAMFAPKLGLENFTVLVDYNNLQGYGRAKDICAFEPVADKWQAFGWEVLTVDGHDHQAIQAALQASHNGKPKAIIANTIKGKGVSFMEDKLEWHYYIVTDELRDQALGELQ